MATFILLKRDQNEDEDGVITVNTRHHTVEEIAEMLGTDPSAFITVPESHAAQIIRPQGRYQEIEEHVTAKDGTNSRATSTEGTQSPDLRLGLGKDGAGSRSVPVSNRDKSKSGNRRNKKPAQ